MAGIDTVRQASEERSCHTKESKLNQTWSSVCTQVRVPPGNGRAWPTNWPAMSRCCCRTWSATARLLLSMKQRHTVFRRRSMQLSTRSAPVGWKMERRFTWWAIPMARPRPCTWRNGSPSALPVLPCSSPSCSGCWPMMRAGRRSVWKSASSATMCGRRSVGVSAGRRLPGGS